MFFGQIKLNQKRSFWDVLDRKERFLDQKSKVLKKSDELKFSQRVSPCFLSKNRIFLSTVFGGKSSLKRSFFDSLG